MAVVRTVISTARSKLISKDSTREVHLVLRSQIRRADGGTVEAFKANLDLCALRVAKNRTITIPNTGTNLPEEMGDVTLMFALCNLKRALSGDNFTVRCNFGGRTARFAQTVENSSEAA